MLCGAGRVSDAQLARAISLCSRRFILAALNGLRLISLLVATGGEFYAKSESLLDWRSDLRCDVVPDHGPVRIPGGGAEQQKQFHFPAGFRIPLRAGGHFHL